MQDKRSYTKLGLSSLAVILFSLSGCSMNGSANNGTAGGGITPVSVPNAITLDTNAIVPVFANQQTTTLTYVHNNSDRSISGINYSSYTNIDSNQSLSFKSSAHQLHTPLSAGIIDPESAKNCATIAAHGSCALVIKSPLLGASSQGSGLLSVDYKQADGKEYVDSQVVNFSKVATNDAGVKFSSNLIMAPKGHQSSYGVFYLYGSGLNKIYKVNSIKPSNSAIKIQQGDITNKQIASNYVQAIEVSTALNNSGYSGNLTVNASDDTPVISNNKSIKGKTNTILSSSYDAIGNLGVPPSGDAAMLTSSLAPIIDTVSGTSGSFFIVNSGNQAATITSITPTSGITIDSNENGCSGSLAAGASCEVSYSVSQEDPSSPTANSITVNYTGGINSTDSTAQAIYWYNSKNTPMVGMIASGNPVIMVQNHATPVTITVTNVGGFPLTIGTLPTPHTYSGSAVATIQDAGTCTGTLAIGATCSFNLSVSDTEAENNKQINVYFSGSYTKNQSTQAYTSVMPLYYSSTSSKPIITISTPASMTIVGNDIATNSQTLTITNVGTEQAELTAQGLINNPSYLTASEGIPTCDDTLAPSTSCDVNVILGPTSQASLQSGIATYTVTYKGLGQASTNTTQNISWQVTPNSQDLTLTTVGANNSTSGNGTDVTPFQFSGNTPSSSQAITLTYANQGTRPLTIKGIQDGAIGVAWLRSSSSTCIVGMTLAVNDTCDIVYTNNLAVAARAVALATSTYTENIPVPTFILMDNSRVAMQFITTPNLPSAFSSAPTTVRAVSNNATLTNNVQVINQGTQNATVQVTHIIANGMGYSSIGLNSTMEDYFTGAALSPSMATGCTQSASAGIVTETCSLTPAGDGTVTATSSYPLNYTLFSGQAGSLNVLFNLTDSNYTIGMTPSYQQVTINQIP